MDNNQNKLPKNSNKIFNTILTVLVAIIIVFALLFTIVGLSSRSSDQIPVLFGQGYLVVQSDSMNADDEKIADNKEKNYPAAEGFKRGDILLVETYSYETLVEMLQNGEHFQVGDVITFQDIINNVLSYNTHRIVEVIRSEDGTSISYRTQGDAYSTADLAQVNHTAVLASWKSTAKSVGNVILFLQEPVGFLVCIILPLLVLLVLEGFNFAKALKEYRLEKKGITPGSIVKSADKSPDDLQAEIERLRKQLEEQQKAKEETVVAEEPKEEPKEESTEEPKEGADKTDKE